MINRNRFKRILCVVGAFLFVCLIGLSMLGANRLKMPKKSITAKADSAYYPTDYPDNGLTVGNQLYIPFYTYTLFSGSGTLHNVVTLYTDNVGSGLVLFSITGVVNPSTLVLFDGSTLNFLRGSPLTWFNVLANSEDSGKVNEHMTVKLTYLQGLNNNVMLILTFNGAFVVQMTLPLFNPTPSQFVIPGLIVNGTVYGNMLSNSDNLSKVFQLSSVTVKRYIVSTGVYTVAEYEAYGAKQYDIGNQNGYDRGYAKGLESGGSYSFLGLITSVIDVPVKAFVSLLDFEILGYNMRSFFLSILTACVVVSVIRLFTSLGG